ncbi:ribonuclease H-like domain-containing protein [Xylaria sp. FL0043]|nr:ribonuclease H-like domain-containing protein [Xylaria sp. FL0043]
MPIYCAPCKRSFKEQSHLDQHLENSLNHKSPAERLSLAIASSSGKQPVTIPAVHDTTRGANLPWSVTPVHEWSTILHEVSQYCHSPNELEEHGYIVRPYNPLYYVAAGKCTKCHRKQTRIISQECTFHPSKRLQGGPYKCCNTSGRGCKTLPSHDFRLPARASTHKDSRPSPPPSAEPKFRAVVIDCEMVGVVGGAGEVVSVCAADFVTGAVLVNRLVRPGQQIIQMRSSIHGITKSALDKATAQGQALAGWKGARLELWKYIDADTILVGHALQHDLNALRMIHPRVVDSGILSGNAVGHGRTQVGLQALCSELVNIEIRHGGGGIHDGLEDVLATREVVLFCTRARNKEAFRRWAVAKKLDKIRLENQRKAAKEEKEKERLRRNAARARGGNSSYADYDLEDEDEEVLHWSDIAEDLGWPHPDTGYDPWSD